MFFYGENLTYQSKYYCSPSVSYSKLDKIQIRNHILKKRIRIQKPWMFFHFFIYFIPVVINLFYFIFYLVCPKFQKTWIRRTFSVVNARVLRGHCERLRNFLTLSFLINCRHFQALIAENFGILAPENEKIKSAQFQDLTHWYLLHRTPPLYHSLQYK